RPVASLQRDCLTWDDGSGRAVDAHLQFDLRGDVPVFREKASRVQGAKNAVDAAIRRVDPGGRKLTRPEIVVFVVKIGAGDRGPHVNPFAKPLIPRPVERRGKRVPSTGEEDIGRIGAERCRALMSWSALKPNEDGWRGALE